MDCAQNIFTNDVASNTLVAVKNENSSVSSFSPFSKSSSSTYFAGGAGFLSYNAAALLIL